MALDSAFHAEHVAVIEEEAQSIDAIMHVVGVANVDANIGIVQIRAIRVLIRKYQFPYQSWCFLEFSYFDCAAESAFVYLQSSLTH
jgi:hypothetical protein